MPYRLPDFNLLCNVWHGKEGLPDIAGVDPDIENQPCGLRFPRGHIQELIYFKDDPPDEKAYYYMHLMVPMGTELLTTTDATFGDIVEVEAGSQRYYRVMYFDRVAYGHPNEFWQGFLQKIAFVAGP